MQPTRYFRITYDNQIEGRYCGTTPQQAAKKAFTKLYQKKDFGLDTPVHFSVKECTRGSRKKAFHYIGTRSKLAHPQEVRIGDKCIIYKHTARVRPDKKQYNENAMKILK